MLDEIEFIDENEDDTWSASKLQVINTCGKQFFYKYREKAEEKQTPYLSFGKTVHKVIEMIHKANDFSEDFWKEAWLKEWAEASDPVDFTGYYKPMFVNTGKRMLSNYAKDNQNANILELESSFPNDKEVYKIGRFVVRGIIDQVRRTDGGRLLIVDHKTSKYPLDPAVLRAAPQFSIYYMVVKQKYPGEDPLLAYNHLESGKMYYTNRDDNDVLKVEAMLIEAQRKVDQGMFERNVGQACRYCPFLEQCLGIDYIGEHEQKNYRGIESIPRT
jgi:CRISPR/Cas system-associated exonuclease Cas4 (RecB family)